MANDMISSFPLQGGLREKQMPDLYPRQEVEWQ
jgi:hypothetical protein